MRTLGQPSYSARSMVSTGDSLMRDAVIVEAVRTPIGKRGCATQVDEQGVNIGRLAPLIAGFPESVPGTSVNRMCASGLQAFNFASMEIMTDQADVVIAGGVESMSRVPLGSDGGALSPKLL